MTGGSETKTRSFKNFLNQKSKLKDSGDSSKKSWKNNSGNASGEVDKMKLSYMSDEEP